jgi:hypothetical protein
LAGPGETAVVTVGAGVEVVRREGREEEAFTKKCPEEG